MLRGMRTWLAVIAVAAGCAPAGCGRPMGAGRAAPPPPPRRIGPPVVPTALRDDAERVLPRRARVARGGPVRLERDGTPLETDRAPADAGAVHVVAAETRSWVQLRSDGDDARLLVWVRRADLAPVAIRARRLVLPDAGGHGAVLRPGAAVTIAGTHGATRDVTFDDGAVIASGAMPAADLGTVFDARRPRTSDTTGSLAAGTRIVAAPGPAAPVVATVVRSVDARALAPARDGFVEIELDRPWVYVRGFVPADALSPGDHMSLFTSGGMGYAMSDTDSLPVSSGACLYARPGGPIVGVNVADRIRYAAGLTRPGWRSVAVATSWGLVWPAVHYPEKHGKATGDFDHCPTK
jgi:hypothetical protein